MSGKWKMPGDCILSANSATAYMIQMDRSMSYKSMYRFRVDRVGWEAQGYGIMYGVTNLVRRRR